MALRFKRPLSRQEGLQQAQANTSDGLGGWWAGVAIVTLALMGILTLAGGTRPGGLTPVDNDPTPEILSSLLTAERALAEIDKNFATLCRAPVLVALELEPDCATGTMTLGDHFFLGSGGSQLKSEAKEDVGAAMTTYLSRLRRMPAIWESLEAIEIRGHSDPRALRNAYETNLVGSQQRALGVLLFLVGEEGLSDEDRADLEKLATVSGVSFSRPPASCPEQSRECYPEWRRVEIIPVLSESLRRGDWSPEPSNQFESSPAARKSETKKILARSPAIACLL